MQLIWTYTDDASVHGRINETIPLASNADVRITWISRTQHGYQVLIHDLPCGSTSLVYCVNAALRSVTTCALSSQNYDPYASFSIRLEGLIHDREVQRPTRSKRILRLARVAELHNKAVGDSGPFLEQPNNTKHHVMPKIGLCSVLELPEELLLDIASRLSSNADLMNWRLVCSRFCSTAVLRFERVFISASKRDIEVIRAIAANTTYARQVKELVWQDAHFEIGESEPDGEDEIQPTYFGSYTTLSEGDRLLHYRLYEEQQVIVDNGIHAAALRDVLPLFTSLERVTITDVGGPIARAVYPSPMVRAVTTATYKPALCSWRRPEDHTVSYPGPIWRGFLFVIDELALSDRAIKELVIDASNGYGAGIPHTFFGRAGNRVKPLERICARGLEQLVITIDVQENVDASLGLPNISAGPVRDFLSLATSLTHLELHASRGIIRFQNGGPDNWRTLEAIPGDCLPALQHLTVSSVPILVDDLVTLVRSLPSTMRELHFVNLVIVGLMQNWATALPAMKRALPWTQGLLTVEVITTRENLPPQMHVNSRFRIDSVNLSFEHEGYTTSVETWGINHVDPGRIF
nr:hypothetical protein CFP56_21708 [Quercus suber]